ncbi:MAG TPA: glycosyltransferase family 1 protein [Coleofasciculaceae cyanobacterium]|jgi:glycosyltransferase involved in cell wall biosynthesis
MLNKNSASDYQPSKILHVVGGMNRGGIETWLMHILRNIDRDRYKMDFLVHTTQPCAYDDEIRALGSRIIPCTPPSVRWWNYNSNFTQILKQYGSYDIVHSHVHHFSGYILRLAKQSQVPVRIAHSHNDTSSAEAKAGWKRKIYLALMERLIARYATLGLAASHEAAADLFGSLWKKDSRWQILYYGLDLTPFEKPVDSLALHAEFNVPPDAFVIGHVGRFETQKNHQFILEIAAEVTKQEPKMRLLLIGDGPLRQDIEQKVAQLNLSDRVIFAGLRSDVPQLMLGMIDVFLFPSLYEGLGLVFIEAQAAGITSVLSDVVPKAADVVAPLVKRLSLSNSALSWAEAILNLKHEAKTAIARSEALSLVANSQFNLEVCLEQLTKIYQSQFS